MPKIVHHTSVSYSPFSSVVGTNSVGYWAATAEDVRELGTECDLPVTGQQGVAKLEVLLSEDDPKLARFYQAVWEKYQLRPRPRQVVPLDLRPSFLGGEIEVTWSKSEIDACELLWLRCAQPIATHSATVSGPAEAEHYVAVNDAKQRSGVQFGVLTPFSGLALAEPLRASLLSAGLQGLFLEPVHFVPEGGKVAKPLWALKSRVILPPPMNLLLGEHGNVVKPNTEWWCWWDDDNRQPAVLRYSRQELAALPAFDIAMTDARVGQTERGAYRQCIITQRFREVLLKLKVKGLEFVPVSLV